MLYRGAWLWREYCCSCVRKSRPNLRAGTEGLFRAKFMCCAQLSTAIAVRGYKYRWPAPNKSVRRGSRVGMLRRGSLPAVEVQVPSQDDEHAVPMASSSSGKSPYLRAATRAARRFSPYKRSQNQEPQYPKIHDGPMVLPQPTLGLSGPLGNLNMDSGPISSRTRRRRMGFKKPLPAPMPSEADEVSGLMALIASGPTSHRQRPAPVSERTAPSAPKRQQPSAPVAEGPSSSTDPVSTHKEDGGDHSLPLLPAHESAPITVSNARAWEPTQEPYRFLGSSCYGVAAAAPSHRHRLHPRAQAKVDEIKEATRRRSKDKQAAAAPLAESAEAPPTLWGVSGFGQMRSIIEGASSTAVPKPKLDTSSLVAARPTGTKAPSSRQPSSRATTNRLASTSTLSSSERASSSTTNRSSTEGGGGRSNRSARTR